MKHTKFAASAAILLCTISLIGCGGTGETSSAFLDSADMLGDVAAVSENGFSLSPLTQSKDGTTSIAAADPSTASNNISIVYGEVCSFQKASLNTGTGKASYSDATRDDLKIQSSVAVYGKQPPSGEFLAERVFLITYE